MIRKLAVYCGSRSGNNPRIIDSTRELGQLMAEHGVELIYGGGSVGIMGILADTILEHGGEVTGVIPSFLEEKELGHQGIQNLIVVDSMHERKLKMVDLAEAFLILPGSIGTMDEFFEVLTWRQLDIHDKPIYILSIDQYFGPLLDQLNHMLKEDFLDKKTFALFETFSDVSMLRHLFKQQY